MQTKESNTMNISLSQKEITAAIRAYVSSRGIAAVGMTMSEIKFMSTRNPAGITAELVLEDRLDNSGDVPGYTDRPADPKPPVVIGSEAGLSTEEKIAAEPTPGTIGAAIAGVLETTAAADADAQVAAADPAPAIDETEVKSVPEEVAQAADAAVDAAPAVTETPAAATAPASTTSLFGN